MSVYRNLLKSGYFPLCKEYDYDILPPLNLPNTPGFKFLFDKYQSHLSRYHAVPPTLVFKLMLRLTEPFLGEFVEVTDNPEFVDVSTPFMSGLFGHSNIGVSYEDFNKILETAELDISQEEKVKSVIEDFAFPNKPSFQLGQRVNKDENGNGHFLHIQTGLQMRRDNWKEDFIEVFGNGLIDNFRFINGFELAYQMILDRENDILLCHLATKRMRVHFSSDPDKRSIELIKSIFNGSPFFFDKDQKSVVMDTPPLIEPQQVKEFQTSIYLRGDRELAELGRVANTNPKMERLTTGENYKDIVAVANRQRMTLNQLKSFAFKAQEKGGVELKFAINGIPERVSPETDIELAGQGPNQDSGNQFGSGGTKF